MKFTATAVVVAIAASLNINPVRVRADLFDVDGKTPKRSPSSSGSLDEYSYTESTNFAGTYTQCSVVVTHSSASGDLDDTYRGCTDENSSPVVFTITKTGDGYGAYKATTMPPEFVSDDFVMGGWQGFAKGNTLSMSSFGAAFYSMFPKRVAQPVLYNDSPNMMICSTFKYGVLECIADITEYKEDEWLHTYSMKSVFVREGFSCPTPPLGFCKTPFFGDPISEDTVADKCGGRYSGNIVVSLKEDLMCNQDNTVDEEAAITLTNGATLDCEGHELSMGDDVNIQFGVLMIDTATVRNCIVSKFELSNAEIESQSGVTTITDSTFSESKTDGVWVEQDHSQEGNVVVLKNVIASSNTRYGIYSPGAGGDNNSHKIKLEGSILANQNGSEGSEGGGGFGLAGHNKVEVFGEVRLLDNVQYGLLFLRLSSGYVTLIGGDIFYACGNSRADIASFSSRAQVTPSYPDGDYYCDKVYNGEFGKLPEHLCQLCYP